MQTVILKNAFCMVGQGVLGMSLENSALNHEEVRGSGCIDPRILGVGTSWSGQLHAPFTLPPGKGTRYGLNMRLGGPHKRPGRCKRRQILPLLELELRTLCCPAHIQSLYGLWYPGSQAEISDNLILK
jgi:hypothetical protein